MTLEEFNKLDDKAKADVLNTPEKLKEIQDDASKKQDEMMKEKAKLEAELANSQGQLKKVQVERDEAKNLLYNGVTTTEDKPKSFKELLKTIL